jgi:hypothetical protein
MKNHENPHAEDTLSGLSFEPSTSQTRKRSANHSNVSFPNPCFYINGMYATVKIKACKRTLFRATSFQFMSSWNIFLTFTFVPSGLFPWGSQNKILYYIFFLPFVQHVPTSQPSLLSHHDIIRRRIQIMKLKTNLVNIPQFNFLGIKAKLVT